MFKQEFEHGLEQFESFPLSNIITCICGKCFDSYDEFNNHSYKLNKQANFKKFKRIITRWKNILNKKYVIAPGDGDGMSYIIDKDFNDLVKQLEVLDEGDD